MFSVSFHFILSVFSLREMTEELINKMAKSMSCLGRIRPKSVVWLSTSVYENGNIGKFIDSPISFFLVISPLSITVSVVCFLMFWYYGQASLEIRFHKSPCSGLSLPKTG